MPKPEMLGDAPIEHEYADLMNKLAHILDTGFNGHVPEGKDKETGFILIVFKFGDDSGRTNYISNADRKDVVTMLKHQIKRFEGQPDVKGTA
jgi:hypothetical protein